MAATKQPVHEPANHEPTERALTIREVADAAGVHPRTIRRRLHAGEMPGAFKTPAPHHPIGVWCIPLTDLRRAGILTEPATIEPERIEPERIEPETIAPETIAPETTAPDATAPETIDAIHAVDTPDAVAAEPVRGVNLHVVGTDRFARLRSELAEAVAAAELSLVRAEIEKWRAVAEERGRALERADFVLKTVAAAGGSAAPAISEPSATPVPEAPHPDIPEHVREEARRYAVLAEALRELPPRSRWRRHAP